MSVSPRRRVKVPTWKLVHKELVDETKDTRRRLNRPQPLTTPSEIERNTVTYEYRWRSMTNLADFVNYKRSDFGNDYLEHDRIKPSSPLLRKITSIVEDGEKVVLYTESVVEAIEELRTTDGYDMEDGFYLEKMNGAMNIHNYHTQQIEEDRLAKKDLENRPRMTEICELVKRRQAEAGELKIRNDERTKYRLEEIRDELLELALELGTLHEPAKKLGIGSVANIHELIREATENVSRGFETLDENITEEYFGEEDLREFQRRIGELVRSAAAILDDDYVDDLQHEDLLMLLRGIMDEQEAIIGDAAMLM